MDATVQDEIIEVQHELHRSAARVLADLAKGQSVGRLYAEHSPLETAQITEILGFCNQIGALTVARKPRKTAAIFFHHVQDFLIGVTHASLSQRYSANFVGVIRAVTVACRGIILTGLITGILSGFAFTTSLATITRIYLFCCLTFVGSMVAHEYAHIRVLRHYGIRAVVLRQRSHVKVLHRAHGTHDMVVALAGPLAGCASAVIAWLATAFFSVPYANIVTLLIASLHCISLLPFYADGKSLKQYKRTQKGGLL